MRVEMRPVLASHVRLQFDPVTREPVLLSPENIVTLNETSHEILARCDGRKSVQAIIEELALDYDTPVPSLTVDVIQFLAELHQEKLIILMP